MTRVLMKRFEEEEEEEEVEEEEESIEQLYKHKTQSSSRHIPDNCATGSALARYARRDSL
jgi:hypothetical protein